MPAISARIRAGRRPRGGEERLQAVRAEHLRAGVHAHDEKSCVGSDLLEPFLCRRVLLAAACGDDRGETDGALRRFE